MASQLRAMLSKLFGSPEYRLVIFGLDATGKTTILYKLKLNECVTTIPTIGFNVETIAFNNTALTIWDIGGCDKMRPLIRHYCQDTRGLIFVVDAEDSSRLEEATDELWRLIGGDDLIGTPILIYLNKIDKCRGLQPELFITKMKLGAIKYRQWFVQPCSALTGEGLYDGLNWLVAALQSPSASQHICNASTSITDNNRFEHISLQWLSQVDDDTVGEFIEKFEKQQLPETFDHRLLLRVLWSYLKIHGRKKTVSTVFDKIKVYIPDMNETLTYFWIQIVHYTQEATKNPTNDFMGFLLMNPQLLNEVEFPLAYYKKETLFSDQARTTIVLPDVKQLPSILPQSSIKLSDNLENPVRQVSEQSVEELEDDGFLNSFESCTLTNWSHKTHLRMAWLYLTRNNRRIAVNKIFDGIKNFIQNSQIARKTTFHFTMTYFWIQMIDWAIAQSPKGNNFEQFLSFNQHLMNGSLFLEYYNKETLLNNPIARQEMVLPDIQPLPTMVASSNKK